MYKYQGVSSLSVESLVFRVAEANGSPVGTSKGGNAG
jgi:hypothetical protein